MTKDLDRSKIAEFYGLSEAEFVRRNGTVLETNIQALKDALSDTIMEKILERRDLWNEKANALFVYFKI